MAPFLRSISPSAASSFFAPSKRCVLVHFVCEQALAGPTGQSLSVQLPRPGLGDPTGSRTEALIGCDEARGAGRRCGCCFGQDPDTQAAIQLQRLPTSHPSGQCLVNALPAMSSLLSTMHPNFDGSVIACDSHASVCPELTEKIASKSKTSMTTLLRRES